MAPAISQRTLGGRRQTVGLRTGRHGRALGDAPRALRDPSRLRRIDPPRRLPSLEDVAWPQPGTPRRDRAYRRGCRGGTRRPRVLGQVSLPGRVGHAGVQVVARFAFRGRRKAGKVEEKITHPNFMPPLPAPPPAKLRTRGIKHRAARPCDVFGSVPCPLCGGLRRRGRPVRVPTHRIGTATRSLLHPRLCVWCDPCTPRSPC